MKPQVVLSGVAKSYGETPAVADLSLEVGDGEVFCLLGPSGCGKSTTLRLIAGLEAPDAGSIEIGGTPVAGGGTWLPPEERKVGIVFQDYALFPHMRVRENVAFGLRGWSRRDARRRVDEVLELVGLYGMEERYPHELSSGQQQRVAIARALAPEPEVLLLDEPFSNLDLDLRRRIRQDIRRILREAGITAIFVTHDQEEAFYIADRLGVMRRGRLWQVGTPEEVFHTPATPFVARFVGTADFLRGVVRDGRVRTALGEFEVHGEFPEGAEVEVMVRPEYIEIEAEGAAEAVVVERTFLGGHYLYTLRLLSGERVRCLQHHDVTLEAGTRVRLRLRASHTPVVFPRSTN